MDRALDDIIDQRGPPRRPQSERRGPPPPRPRREEYPRDGVKKPYRNNRETVNFESDWVHDRFEEDRYERGARRAPRNDYDAHDDRAAPAYDYDYPRDSYPKPALTHPDYSDGATKLRVDNVHYDLTEDDLRSLFEEKGPTVSVKLIYDRMDRSEGTAFIVYEDPRDARRAIADFDGQNANGQPIRITLLPTAPAASRARRGPEPSLFDRIQKPERSMFERMDPRDAPYGFDSGDELGRRRSGARPAQQRERSDSPRKSKPVPEHIDRYTPGGPRDSRSPIRRRGTPRDDGRRPGARRDDNGRGGGGRGGGRERRHKIDEEGRPLVGGRPKKTADELDAEMEDYWGGKAANGNGDAAQNGQNGVEGPNTAAASIDDIDMDV